MAVFSKITMKIGDLKMEGFLITLTKCKKCMRLRQD